MDVRVTYLGGMTIEHVHIVGSSLWVCISPALRIMGSSLRGERESLARVYLQCYAVQYMYGYIAPGTPEHL
jgi:hypothetical protein